MPKVLIYKCSLCTYKSKDKLKAEKHIKLHNFLVANGKYSEKDSPKVDSPKVKHGTLSQTRKNEANSYTSRLEADLKARYILKVEQEEKYPTRKSDSTKKDKPATPSSNDKPATPSSNDKPPTSYNDKPPTSSKQTLRSKLSLSVESLDAIHGQTTVMKSAEVEHKTSDQSTVGTVVDSKLVKLGNNAADQPFQSSNQSSSSSSSSSSNSIPPNKSNGSNSAGSPITKSNGSNSAGSPITLLEREYCTLSKATTLASQVRLHLTTTLASRLQLKEDESLEENRVRYYVEIKQEILHGDTQEENTEIKEENMDEDVKPQLLPEDILGTGKDQHGQVQTPETQRRPEAEILEEWRHVETGELMGTSLTRNEIERFREEETVVPELITKAHCVSGPLCKGATVSGPLCKGSSSSKRSKRHRLDDSKSSKKLKTGHLSCKFDVCKFDGERVLSFKKGLLESVTTVTEVKTEAKSPSTPGTQAAPSPDTSSAPSTDTSSAPSPDTSSAPSTDTSSAPSTDTSSAARLIPLSQPPLVAPLTVPVTDLLTVNNQSNIVNTSSINCNILNIPVRMGGVVHPSPSILVPLTVNTFPPNLSLPQSPGNCFLQPRSPRTLQVRRQCTEETQVRRQCTEETHSLPEKSQLTSQLRNSQLQTSQLLSSSQLHDPGMSDHGKSSRTEDDDDVSGDISEIKSMLRSVCKMMSDTQSVVDMILKRVERMESGHDQNRDAS